mmetsp:Transcript_13401/g.31614  ORF Transcript_13401/g.31614 Transcript_13401/m.31614 type:complete len:287 (-) Transcript_13401:745-1605(-)|eukprot:scaffold49569_cov69-Phaeocystis_antarctica.AAC.3
MENISRRQGLVDCHLGVEKGVCERLRGARPLVPLWVEQQSQQVPARAAGTAGVEQLHPSHATDAQPVIRIQVLAQLRDVDAVRLHAVGVGADEGPVGERAQLELVDGAWGRVGQHEAGKQQQAELAHVVGAGVARTLEGVTRTDRAAQRAFRQPQLERVRRGVARLGRLAVGAQLEAIRAHPVRGVERGGVAREAQFLQRAARRAALVEIVLGREQHRARPQPLVHQPRGVQRVETAQGIAQRRAHELAALPRRLDWHARPLLLPVRLAALDPGEPAADGGRQPGG